MSTLKNEKISLEKQIETLKRDIENERKSRISLSLGANQTDQHIIQQLNAQLQEFESKNKELVNHNISLRDTLNELRRTHNQTLNELDETKRLNLFLKSQVEGLDREKNDLTTRIRADSNAEIQAETESMKLRLRINELEREAREV